MIPAIEEGGWDVTGLDYSSDMLRRASARSARLVRGDAAALPFASSSFEAVCSLMAWTDFDDVGPVFAEVSRILRPAGRLVCVGTHPCFIGPFARRNADNGTILVHPGYTDTSRRFEGPGLGGEGVRAKAVVRHVPLAELVNKLGAAGLSLERADELVGDPPVIFAFAAS